MNETTVKAPTRKAFHFPKGETVNAATEGGATKKKAATAVPSEKPATTATAAKPAAPKKAAARKAVTKKASAAQPATGATPAKKSSPKKAAVAKDSVTKAAAAAADALRTDVVPVEKVKREKKEKVVRDSFTMPKSDYAKIATLKQKCLDAGVHVKKSELLRAGLVLLEGVSEKRLAAVLADLETVKTGRPAKA